MEVSNILLTSTANKVESQYVWFSYITQLKHCKININLLVRSLYMSIFRCFCLKIEIIQKMYYNLIIISARILENTFVYTSRL